MAKLGRYSANKYKASNVSSNTTLDKDDCGKVLFVTASCTITLPNAATAGAGWWCRIVKNYAAAGGAISITATSSLDGVGIDGDGVGVALSGDCTIHTDTGKGTVLEVVSDGSQWFATGLAATASGFSA